MYTTLATSMEYKRAIQQKLVLYNYKMIRLYVHVYGD